MDFKCSGLSSSEDYYNGFTCKACLNTKPHKRSRPTDEPATHVNEEENASFWSCSLPGTHAAELQEIHQKAVHWKSILFILSKNKTLYKLVNTRNNLLSVTATLDTRAEKALMALMPYLTLARTKTETMAPTIKPSIED